MQRGRKPCLRIYILSKKEKRKGNRTKEEEKEEEEDNFESHDFSPFFKKYPRATLD